jgi:hypothetical protein
MQTLRKNCISEKSYIQKLLKHSKQSKQAKYNTCFVKTRFDKTY